MFTTGSVVASCIWSGMKDKKVEVLGVCLPLALRLVSNSNNEKIKEATKLNYC
jgi:hypothetical protein